MKYEPEYTILKPEDMKPRDEIKINPKEELSPESYIQLRNIQKGTSYKLVTADTPQNRKIMNFRTAYFQMVACKEGWEFDPQLYQVKFVNEIPKGLETEIKILENNDKGLVGFDTTDRKNPEKVEDKTVLELRGLLEKLF
jgi:hypothetical protein